ncbi:MAG: Tm-1-like ATP-binding domain-containing protein [Pseudomonadales bacterium]
MREVRVLVVGTYDTKTDELNYLAERIESQGASTLTMDISVLGETSARVDISKHDVAAAAGVTIDDVIASGDENSAMQLMAQGAVALTKSLFAAGDFEAVISMGGTMGTDLSLDVAAALPMGVPKYIISTVAFSPLIGADRLAADIQMILWAGGLYGLNSICKSSLSQAAGAVVGAARAVEPPQTQKPLIGMTSLGKSCLKYMVTLKPALEARGYEVAVFHATGMGGRAFESLAEQGAFAAVMDFAPQELANWVHGSAINAGDSRMLGAGAQGIPQLWAPGCMDLVDLPEWQPLPEKFNPDHYHAHNRLLGSVVLNAEQRRETAVEIAARLNTAKAPVHVFLPRRGIEEWDREGADLHAPKALAVFLDEISRQLSSEVAQTELDAHINDDAFCEAALSVFDTWVAEGIVAPGVTD